MANAKRRYKAANAEKEVLSAEIRMPFERPVAVYYRQSTFAQVGNISTAIQTIDMVAELQRRGWKKDDIVLIDMDAAVSGTKKIDERPGMKLLFELISKGKIGAVACEDEDRLFRDVTQIQVNIFIEACRAAHILVLTPSMVYDFANEVIGQFHARQFRFKCELAAEYINTVIKGKHFIAPSGDLPWKGDGREADYPQDICLIPANTCRMVGSMSSGGAMLPLSHMPMSSMNIFDCLFLMQEISKLHYDIYTIMARTTLIRQRVPHRPVFGSSIHSTSIEMAFTPDLTRFNSF
jgi:hypothetical protein